MVCAISAFMKFCYLVHRSQIEGNSIDKIDTVISHFHQECNIFIESGVQKTFKLPQQHSLSHYHFLIQQFGAPNGLCSSIIECWHIMAVKNGNTSLQKTKAHYVQGNWSLQCVPLN